MSKAEPTEEFRTSPLATRVIAALSTIIVGVFGWWCVRVTSQLDTLLESASKNDEMAKTVSEHGQYLQDLYARQNDLDKSISNQQVHVTGLVKDMDIVKTKLFK